MAEPYLTRLTQLARDIGPLRVNAGPLETRHFFSGAALYANGKIVATLSPAGFAVKLPTDQKGRLIEEGRGAEFRFFPGGPVKRDYVSLSESTVADPESLRELIEAGVDYVRQAPGR
jgi:TfoX/Sxy family transcriptional regulator of competence genes